jgi:hypothetical protein
MSINNYNNALGLPLKGNCQCRVMGVSPRGTGSHTESSEQRSDSLLTENTDLLRDHWEMPSSDVQILNWIQSKTDYKWYLFTVTFSDSSIVPRRDKYISVFDTYVHRRIHKQVGYSHRPITVVREYECGVIGSSGNINCPHHVHCILGVPVTARNDRLIKGYRRAIACPKSRLIESADLKELKTDSDVERAYCYIRKGKWHRTMGT